MNIGKTSRLLLLLLLFFPAIPYADKPDILSWTSQTLLNTFTLNYKTMDKQLASSKTFYTPSAWSALESFFSDKATTVQNEQLNLYPKLLGEAQLINSGAFANVAYWQISQGISIPELSTQFNAIVVIIRGNTTPYVIQSLNITSLQ